MDAVADDLGRHVVVLEHGAGQPGGTMADGRHAIEQMRRVPGAGVDALERLFVRRARVAERHAMAVRGERADQSERAVDLGRDGDDPDVGPRRRNLVEDRLAGELALGPGPRGQAQALERLRAAILRVDEIAFEVRRQHARDAPAGRANRAARTAPSMVRSASGAAGDRRRAERGHAEARQPRRDARDGMRRRRASRSLRRRGRARRQSRARSCAGADRSRDRRATAPAPRAARR